MNAGGVSKACKSNGQKSVVRDERSEMCYDSPPMIRSYTDILVYKQSKSLYPIVMELAKTFPPHGRHLRDQLCRAANSIHANIAEGFGRSQAEFKMYLTRALGSCNEVKSHLEDAMAVKMMTSEKGQELIDEYMVIGKQLYRLRERWH